MSDEKKEVHNSETPKMDILDWANKNMIQAAQEEFDAAKNHLKQQSSFTEENFSAHKRKQRAGAHLKKLQKQTPEYRESTRQQLDNYRAKAGNITLKQLVTRRYSDLMAKPGVQKQFTTLYERTLLYLDRPSTAPKDPLLELEASFPDTEVYGLPEYMRWQPLKTIAFFEEHSAHAKELIAKMKLTWENSKQHPPFIITLSDVSTILKECPHSDPTQIINHFINVTTTLFGKVGQDTFSDISGTGGGIPKLLNRDISQLDILFTPYEHQKYADLLLYEGSVNAFYLGLIFNARAKKEGWVSEEVLDLLSAISPVRRVIDVEGGTFDIEKELDLLDDLDVMQRTNQQHQLKDN